jgi:hypothetical protein
MPFPVFPIFVLFPLFILLVAITMVICTHKGYIFKWGQLKEAAAFIILPSPASLHPLYEFYHHDTVNTRKERLDVCCRFQAENIQRDKTVM